MHTLARTDTESIALIKSHLNDAARNEFEFRCGLILPLLGLGRAANKRLKELAKTTGEPYGKLRRWYDETRKHGVEALIDRRLAGPAYWDTDHQIGLPSADQELVKRYCGENQRGTEAALRKLRDDWRQGRVRTTQPVDRRTGYPQGWSLDNLRNYAPTDFELAAMRKGLGAALSAHGPKVLTTRVGLWVGSHFMIDDVKRDIEVAFLGGRGGIGCIQELGNLDLYSADRFMVHRRPQYRREDGTKDSIKEREMRYFVAAQLRTIGYSPRGTQYVTELGTAAIRKKLQEFLHAKSNGLITVREPGSLGSTQVLTGWIGSGGGNPRHKAALESHHNLLHNEAAFLPAATGHDRKPPEWLHGLKHDSEQVLEWMRSLPPERAMLLRLPVLEYWQALSLLADIDLQIARRTDHDLEGWAECGHTTIEYREHPDSQEWITQEQLLTLPEHTQHALAVVATTHPLCVRARKLSPREVFSRGCHELRTLPDYIIALMFIDRDLGDDLRQERNLTKEGTIEITDKTVEPDTMIFEGRLVERPDGGRFALDERKSYDIVLNPFDRAALWIYDKRGSYLGTAPRRQRVCQLDTEGIKHQLGQRSHIVAELLGPLQERHADADKLIAEIQRHNERVVQGAPVTPTERQQIREEKKVEVETQSRRRNRFAAEAEAARLLNEGQP